MAAVTPRDRVPNAAPSQRGLLKGPSDGVLKWTAYVFDKIFNPLIDAQLRLRPMAPDQQPPRARWRATLGVGTLVVVLLSAAERLAGL